MTKQKTRIKKLKVVKKSASKNQKKSVAVTSKAKNKATKIKKISSSKKTTADKKRIKTRNKKSTTIIIDPTISESKNNFWKMMREKYTFKVLICKKNRCQPVTSWCHEYGITQRQFIALIIVVLLLGVFDLFLLSSSLSSARYQKITSAQQNNLVRRDSSAESTYRKNIQNVFTGHDIFSDIDNSTEEQLRDTKNSILEIKVPSYYRSLHLNLIVAITFMEQGINDNNDIKLRDGKEKLSQLRIHYPWLK